MHQCLGSTQTSCPSRDLPTKEQEKLLSMEALSGHYHLLHHVLYFIMQLNDPCRAGAVVGRDLVIIMPLPGRSRSIGEAESRSKFRQGLHHPSPIVGTAPCAFHWLQRAIREQRKQVLIHVASALKHRFCFLSPIMRNSPSLYRNLAS